MSTWTSLETGNPAWSVSLIYIYSSAKELKEKLSGYSLDFWEIGHDYVNIPANGMSEMSLTKIGNIRGDLGWEN